MPMTHPGHSNYGPHGAFQEEDAEMPWVGAVATVPDLVRFAEMQRRGGELDGVRILSPALLIKRPSIELGTGRMNYTSSSPLLAGGSPSRVHRPWILAAR